MTKEKQQIEEMAITICRKRHACTLKDNENCRKCDQHERCLYQDIAYALYQEDYRKQSEGEWKPHKDFNPFLRTVVIGGYICSCCENESDETTKFCPYCGAKMEGGAE